MRFLEPRWAGLEWSEWIPLDAGLASFREHIATSRGVYRVRVTGRAALAYIGQTGRNLRERTRTLAIHTLKGLSNPPWNDPHTAAPSLWAGRIEDSLRYEVSVAAVENDAPTLQCLEDMLLYLYRAESGSSTLANHGHFPSNWRRPSNKRDGRRMERMLDGPNATSVMSLPAVPLHGEPGDLDWLRLSWSQVVPLDTCGDSAPKVAGVYRLVDSANVIYLGESASLKARLLSHSRRFRGEGLGVSWVEMPGAPPQHLKERETDVIGAFFATQRVPPRLQYRNAVAAPSLPTSI